MLIFKKILWKPKYINDKNINNYFDNVECKEYYILNEKLVIIFINLFIKN